MLAMATSAQSAATFLAVARLVKEIGTAVNIIINKLCILENMISFFENINVASFHRYWEGKGIGPSKRSWVFFFMQLQSKKVFLILQTVLITAIYFKTILI